jgi:hypothetical protein
MERIMLFCDLSTGHIVHKFNQAVEKLKDRDPKHTFLHFFQKAQKATQFKTILKSTLLV